MVIITPIKIQIDNSENKLPKFVVYKSNNLEKNPKTTPSPNSKIQFFS